MAKKKTAESMVAQTMLQQSEPVEIGGRTYHVAPPSIGTLMKISEYVSYMPPIETRTDDPIGEVLRTAKDCSPVTDIVAIAVLGAKGLTEQVVRKETVKEQVVKKRFFGLLKTTEPVEREVEKVVEIDRLAELSAILREQETPARVSKIFTDILVNRLDIGFFLGITTSLSAVNMTRPTKTTARGR